MISPTVSGLEQRPVLSIISVVLNDPDGLARTLHSLGAFSDEAEVVVVEGVPEEQGHASAQLNAFGWPRPPILISGRDAGPYDAMNRGVFASSGSWLWFVNAGDEIHPGVVSRGLISQLEETNRVWAVGQVVLRDGHTDVLNDVATAEDILSGIASQCHQGVIVHRSALMRVGLFDTRYQIAADYAMLVGLASLDAPLVIREPLAIFFRGGLSTVRRRRLHIEMFLVRLRGRTQSRVWHLTDALRALRRVGRLHP